MNTKKKDVHMDTLMAYHNYLQGRIKENLNSLSLGPGKFYFVISIILFVLAIICMMVGILVITLRHRHVYLVNWDYKFVGPGFIVLFILCMGVGSHFLIHAKRVTNKYRRNLRFLPMGDYGVQVVHVTQIAKKDKQKELKSGRLQHINTPAPRGHTRSYSSNPTGSMGDLSRRDASSSMGYRSDRSHASTPDLAEKPSRYIRGRRDPNFLPRGPPEYSDSADGSKASEPRDGTREVGARPRPPQGRPPPHRGGPYRGGGPPRGPPHRDPRDFDPAHRGRGRGGPRGRGRGGPRGPPRGEPGHRGPRPTPDHSDESGRVPRRGPPVDYDPRGQPPPTRRDPPGPLAYSSDDSRSGKKVPFESSSESEL